MPLANHRCVCQDADPTSPLPPGTDGCTPRTRGRRAEIVPLTAREVRAALADDYSTRLSLREIARAEIAWRTTIARTPAALAAASHNFLATEFAYTTQREQ
jgi:hypothetical protein